MLTFLVGLKGGLWVWVTGKADDIQSGKFGEEIVSPRHSYLWRNEVNLGRREGGREEKGREGGREEKEGREGGREEKEGREGWREGGKRRERRGGRVGVRNCFVAKLQEEKTLPCSVQGRAVS